MSRRVALTIAFALLSAALNALSNVLELSEAERIDESQAMKPGLIVALARRPRWLLGVLCDGGGFFADCAALGLGSVAFVQPIGSLGLPMSMLLGSIVYRRAVRKVDWIGAFVICAGLALFLYEVPPRGGRDLVPVSRWLVAGPAIAGALLLCLFGASLTRGPARGLLLGMTASIAFATSAVLTKAFVHYFGQGVFAWAPHWEPYAMAIVIIIGFVAMQSAFQSGHLAASVAGLQAPGPVVSVVLGIGLLDERVSVGTVFQAFVVVASLTAVVAAILVLAQAEGLVPGLAGAATSVATVD